MKRRLLPLLTVYARAGDRSRGWLVAGSLRLPCALGRGGIGRGKREGDGRTPAGRLATGALWWRPDRGRRPATLLRPRPIRADDGWCDDPGSARYNRPVKRPFTGSHEAMWRDDALYDLVLELGWNMRPAIRGRGSAIFMHVAKPGFSPTEGCVALRAADLRRLLAWIGPRTRIKIAG